MTANGPVLVTGHTGFLGAAVIDRFRETGRAWVGASRGAGVDLERPDALDGFAPTSCVIHLAGRVAVLESWDRPAEFHRANILCTLTALEFARRWQASFVYISSYMYGIPHTPLIAEDHPLDMRNPYAWSKRAGEILAESYARMFGLRVVVLRPFNVFGPGQPRHQLVPYVVDQAVAGDTIEVADLTPRRDWLWSGDFARAVEAVVEHTPPGYSIFNLGTGHPLSVQDVIDAVIAVVGPRRVVCRNQARPNEIPHAICDNRHFAATFGWQPATTLQEGIVRLLAGNQPTSGK